MIHDDPECFLSSVTWKCKICFFLGFFVSCSLSFSHSPRQNLIPKLLGHEMRRFLTSKPLKPAFTLHVQHVSSEVSITNPIASKWWFFQGFLIIFPKFFSKHVTFFSIRRPGLALVPLRLELPVSSLVKHLGGHGFQGETLHHPHGLMAGQGEQISQIYGKYMVNPWLLYGQSMVNDSYPLVMTNSLPWFFDGPNQNRWFTELKNGGSFHGKLLVITRW